MPESQSAVTPSVVFSSEKPGSEAPPWVSRFTVLFSALMMYAGTPDVLQQVRIRRKTGYSFFDALMFIMAMGCWDKSGTIKEFSRISHRDKLDQMLAGICGRRNWPTDSSMSRLLKSVRAEDTKQFRRHILPLTQPNALAKSPWVMTRDTHGQSWAVFDLDGIVTAFRQRALPKGEDLPEPERWTKQIAAAGYPGRKRGEIQVSSHRLQQVGSSAWVGQDSGPGNLVMSDAVDQAASWIIRFSEQAGLEKERILLRIDGAGGNTRCVSALAAKGVHVVVRWPYYEPLERSSIRTHLRGEVWSPVSSSGSGPKRHAADLGEGCWLEGANQLPATTRMVVSRFFSAKEGKKRGSGHVLGPAQYELFATTLDSSEFPAEDVVSLYYGRAAHENSINRANKEKCMQRMLCKTNRHGQNLVQMILMLMWNLETALGAQLLGLPEQRPPQANRPPPQLRSFDDIPELEVTNSDALPPVASEPREPEPSIVAQDKIGTAVETNPKAENGSPAHRSPPAQSVTTTDIVGVLNAAIANQPSWSVSEQHGVRCPQGTTLRLRKQLAVSDKRTTLVFRAPQRACLNCPGRPACTSSTMSNFRKELTITVPAALPRLKGWPPRPLNCPSPTAPAMREKAVGPYLDTPQSWVPPTYLPPGPWIVDGPAVVSADMRVAFRRACEDTRISIRLGKITPRPRQTHHLVPTAAQRQRRRHTHAERFAWNALPPDEFPTVTMLGGRVIEKLLERPFALPDAT